MGDTNFAMPNTETFNATPLSGFLAVCDDTFDLRDMITRFEELEAQKDLYESDPGDEETGVRPELDEADKGEYDALEAFLESVKGAGGDEDWRGDWYPITFIRDDYFETYAEEYASDIGAIDRNSTWPLCFIDWKAAAENLQMDYSSAEWGGVTYWYR